LFEQLVSGAWPPGFHHCHGRAVIGVSVHVSS
jgi:hypothetical protein